MPDDAPFLDLVIRASDVLTENGRRPASIAIAVSRVRGRGPG